MLNQEKDIDKGYVCDCCGSYVKRYTRSFNCNMALTLVLLRKFNIHGFIKIEDFLIANGRRRCGDFSYLVHYGLLEKMQGERKDGSKKNGYYKITGRGLMFADGNLKVPSKFMIFNNSFQGFKGENIGVKEALGKKFDYSELMAHAKTDKEVKQIQGLLWAT